MNLTTMGMNSKTALQHAIFLNDKNVVGTCKDLEVTPQQFNDWIKSRRPVPAERVEQLEEYLHVPAAMLVDERRFAKRISTLSAIELAMTILGNQYRHSEDDTEKEEYEYRLIKLEVERSRQVRIGRLAAILETSDEAKLKRIDHLLDDLEGKNEHVNS